MSCGGLRLTELYKFDINHFGIVLLCLLQNLVLTFFSRFKGQLRYVSRQRKREVGGQQPITSGDFARQLRVWVEAWWGRRPDERASLG